MYACHRLQISIRSSRLQINIRTSRKHMNSLNINKILK